MCGIAGKVNPDRGDVVGTPLLQSMCDAMEHRGPDDEGIFAKDNVGLCMRRLQVVDLPGGHQPMSNEDGSLWIVFNGEIYNYKELRLELESAGHVFQTASDTETILHLFEDKGASCVQDLRGMFSFAIWDTRQQSLFLARDRLGEKPLYYANQGGSLTFASELTALLCDSSIARQIDPKALDEYLTYLFVPHPRTIYRGIYKLPPATSATYAHGVLSTERYWHVRYDQIEQNLTEHDALEELDARLSEAVQMRMLADVPVGAFLSGGLDSTLVASIMQKSSPGAVKTFSIGFEESSFNELEYARTAARELGTDHEECVVGYDVKNLLPDLVRHFGEPFADSSAIPTYHLAKATRRKVTVALSGDGGDEVFGGYRRYQAGQLANAYNLLLGRCFGKPIEWIIGRVPEPTTYYGASRLKKLKRFLEFAAARRARPQTSWDFFLPQRKSVRSIPTTLLNCYLGVRRIAVLNRTIRA
jgi:asparagine synthase (glutamine-hydrolysing)